MPTRTQAQRGPQPFHDRAWLYREYVERKRSTGHIAREFGVTDAAIAYWLRRHNIPRRVRPFMGGHE